MKEYPIIENLRYTFDFRILPNILFGANGENFTKSLIAAKGLVIADLLNVFYKNAGKDYEVEMPDEIFTKDDIRVVAGKIGDNNHILISIDMPDEKCDGIIAIQHLIVTKLDNFAPRLFTVERTSPSETEQLKAMLGDSFKEDMVSNFLCEVEPDKHRNYGVAPKTMDGIVAKLVEILN